MNVGVPKNIHFHKLGLKSKPFFFFFFKPQLYFIDRVSFARKWFELIHVWYDTFTAFWSVHVYEISKLFQVAKDLIFSDVTSYNIS